MKKSGIYFISLIFLMAACYPDGPEYYEDLDIVFTNHTETFDFASQGTYAMPDKIVKVTGNLADGEVPEYIKEPYNSQMLNVIDDNMAALGWEKVSSPENADLVLFPAVWSNTTVVYWYDYWCWYYPYYCGWGWGYGYTTSYTTGTFVMTLVPTEETEPSIEPSSVWTAAINGLVSGNYTISRITEGIDQAFEQSSYLDIN